MPLWKNILFIWEHMGAYLTAASASFVFGMALSFAFLKPWLNAVEKTLPELQHADGRVRKTPFIIAFVAQIIMAIVLSGILHHVGEATYKTAIITTLFLWTGLIVTTMATDHAFARRKVSLTIMESLHWLGVILIQCLILVSFRAT
jgi:Protein of unknown function (DUF1761)